MARDFDGSNDYLSRTTNIPNVNTGSGITLACFFDTDATNQFRAPVSIGTIGDSGPLIHLLKDTTPNIRGECRDDASNTLEIDATDTTIAADGTVYHAALTCTTTSLSVYVDGVVDSNSPDTHAGLGTQSLDRLSIGVRAHDLGQGDWDGMVSEVACWTRALSAEEIAALAKGFSPLFFPVGLHSYIPVIGTGSTELDYVTGDVMTVVGTAPKFPHPPVIMPRGQLIMPIAGGAPPAATPKGPLGMPLQRPLVGPL